MSLIKIKDWPIIIKLSAMGLPVIISLAIIFLYILPSIEEKYYADKNEMLKNVVESAYSTLKYFDGKVADGTLTLEEAQKQAVDQINSYRYSGKEYYFMYDLEGITIALGSDPSKMGENRLDIKDSHGNMFVREFISTVKSKGEGYVDYYYPKLGEKEASPKRSFIKLYEPWKWIIGSGVYIDDVQTNIAAFKSDLYPTIIITILFSVLLLYIISRAISKPVKLLFTAANKIAQGDTKAHVEILSKDELGRLGEAFNQMTANIVNSMNEIKLKNEVAEKAASEAEKAKTISEQQRQYLEQTTKLMLIEMEKFAQGDLTAEINAEIKNEDIGKLFAGFNKAIGSIREMLFEVGQAVEATASSSNEISASVEELAAGAREQSVQASEVASAIQEMTSTIIETTRNTNVAAASSKRSGQSAKTGGEVVKQTVEGMNHIAYVVSETSSFVKKLGENSNQIGEIIQVIDDIADQTNLLALNAAIEAARAGEQGRGFAVVADEVRKLAERTTKATKEIAAMIKQIQTDTNNAVKSMEGGNSEVEKGKALAGKALESLSEIISAADETVDIVNQVAASSEEQSTAAEQITRSVEGITSISHESAQGAQQIAHATEDLNRLTEKLLKLISRFKVQNKMQLRN